MADTRLPLDPLAPDPVIEVFKKDVDRTLLLENLRLTPAERLERLQAFLTSLEEIDGAARDRR